MKTSIFRRSVRVGVSVVAVFGLTVFGFAGIGARASAATAIIDTTGPDSENTIIIANETKCEVRNDTDIGIDNEVNQHASSGDATVSGNTLASGWGAWDPAVWQNKGYTYAEWSAAFNAYLANNQASWQSGWGALSGGGSATSGDASNSSEAVFDLAIENNGCGLDSPAGSHNPGPGSTSGSNNNPHTLGTSTTASGSGGEAGGLFGISSPFSTGGSGSGSGSSGGGGGNNNNNNGNNGGSTPSGGCSASIDTTGPNSDNTIFCGDTRHVSVNNNTSVNVSNSTNQNASSGDATTNQNSSAGGSGSGDASNGGALGFMLTAEN